VSYAYDAADNRIAKTGDVEGDVSYTLGTGNRLQSWTGGSYTYNDAGCVTRIERVGKPTLDLTWDSQYQLISVATNGVFAEGYAYDALGRRVATTTQEGAVRHVYDNNWQCIADVDATGNVLFSYVWGDGIDNLLAVRIGDETYTALTDIQGTVWGFTDGNGEVVARWTYDAWGNVLSSNVSVTALASLRYRFQGRELSAVTGLTNFRMRWYDPETGRWLSKDPIGLNGGMNLYVFLDNNSLNRRDPQGTVAWFVGMGIGAIVGGVIGGIGSVYNGGDFWKGALSGAIGGAISGATFGLAAPILVTGFGTGAAVGAATGALGGFASGVTTEVLKPCDENFSWGDVGNSTMGGAIGGAIAGSLIGLGGDALREAKNFGAETLISADASGYVEIGVNLSR
jgi:RHS repeat-associated protein